MSSLPAQNPNIPGADNSFPGQVQREVASSASAVPPMASVAPSPVPPHRMEKIVVVGGGCYVAAEARTKLLSGTP